MASKKSPRKHTKKSSPKRSGHKRSGHKRSGHKMSGENTAYCLQCGKHVRITGAVKKTAANKRKYILGKCEKCGRKCACMLASSKSKSK